tara:strand:+ start:87 stop:773 length:687 start_codon:yes stop_codon:yes gene_type:complete
MKKEKLTEEAIKKADFKTKQYKLSDGGGLYLLVHANGSKYWRFDFRFNGKQKSSSLGVWPEVSLKLARIKRDRAKKKIKEGINPIEEKKEKNSLLLDLENGIVSKRKELNSSLDFLEDEIQPASNFKEKKAKSAISQLKSLIYPNIGEKLISDLDRDDIKLILRNTNLNKKKIFQIFWDIYPDYPIVHFGVLILLLILSSDFFSTFITVILYLIITVCISIAISTWNE